MTAAASCLVLVSLVSREVAGIVQEGQTLAATSASLCAGPRRSKKNRHKRLFLPKILMWSLLTDLIPPPVMRQPARCITSWLAGPGDGRQLRATPPRRNERPRPVAELADSGGPFSGAGPGHCSVLTLGPGVQPRPLASDKCRFADDCPS